jgi:hypothetical protein
MSWFHDKFTALIRGSKPDRAPTRTNKVWIGIPDVRGGLFGARAPAYRTVPVRRQR